MSDTGINDYYPEEIPKSLTAGEAAETEPITPDTPVQETVHNEVEDFVRKHEKTIVLEINRDGQLFGIIRKEFPVDLIPKIHSVSFSDGMPPRARVYAEKILKIINGD